MALDDTIINDEFEVVMACYELRVQHLTKGTEKYHKIPVSIVSL
jgi:hypothetical protein